MTVDARYDVESMDKSSGNRFLGWLRRHEALATWGAFVGPLLLGVLSAIGAAIAGAYNAGWMVWAPLMLIALCLLVPFGLWFFFQFRPWRTRRVPMDIDITEAAAAEALKTLEMNDGKRLRDLVYAVGGDTNPQTLERVDPYLAFNLDLLNATVFDLKGFSISGRLVFNGDELGGTIELSAKPVKVTHGEVFRLGFRQWLSPAMAEAVNLEWPNGISLDRVNIRCSAISPSGGNNGGLILHLPPVFTYDNSLQRWFFGY